MPWIITRDFDAIELEIGLNVFYPDAVTDINYSISNRVTEHAVVDDANKTDHIHTELDRVFLRGCVAHTAMRKDSTDLFANADSRTSAACELFSQMAKSGECVSLVTDEKDFGQMMVESASISFQRGDVVLFDLALKEFRTVSLQDVSIQIGSIVQRGEISTVQGRPDTLPVISAEVEQRLEFYDSDPTAFSACDDLPPGAEADACYGSVFSSGF